MVSMQARRQSSSGERGAIRSTLLAATAVVGGNGLVFLLAAAVLIPPREETVPTPAPEVVVSPKAVSAPADAAPVPLPGVARASVRYASATVRVAAPTNRKPVEGCSASKAKSSIRPIKVARHATPDLQPDGG